MAEEKDPGFQRSRANLRITTDSPEGVTPEAETQMLNTLESYGEPFTGTYQDAMRLIVNRSIASTGTPASTGTLENQFTLAGAEEDGPTVEQRFLDEQAAEEAGTDEPKWWEHVIGGIAAITRGVANTTAGAAGPAIAGIATGMVGTPAGQFGIALGIVAMALGEPVTWALEKITGMEFKSPAEGLSDLLTKIGVPESETAAAQLLEGSARVASAMVAVLPAAGAAAKTIGAARAARIAPPAARTIAGSRPMLPPAPGITETMLQTAAGASPLPVMAGEFAEEFAGVGGRRLAEAGTEALGIEDTVLGNTLENLASVATSIFGGGLVEGGLEFLGRAGRATSQSGFRARDPEDAGRSPLTRSEVNEGDFMSTKRGADIQAITDDMVGGTGEMRRRRHWENQQELKGLLGDYGVEVDDLGGIPDFGPELLDKFLNARRVQLTENVNLRNSVIAEMPEGQVVPTTRVDEFLTQQSDILDKRITPVSKQLQQEIATWQAALQEADFATLNAIRRDFADSLNSQANDLIRPQGKQMLDEAYGHLVDDMTDFARQVGGDDLAGQWRTSQDNLAALARDLDDAAIEGIIKQGVLNPDNVTPEIILDRLNSRHSSDVQKIYSRMDEDGQAVVRQAYIAESARAQDFNQLSPNQFSANVAERAQAAGIVFTPEERQTIAGMKNYFDITRRSEEAATGRATGPRGLPISALPGGGTMLSAGVRANMAVGAGVGIAGLFGIGKLSRYIEASPHIKQLFLEMADLSPTSESAVRLSRLIGQALEIEARREATAEHIESSPRIQELFPGLDQSPTQIIPPPPREE